MSAVKAYYHIVFCTKERRMVLPLRHIEDLYRFIWKEITDMECKLLRIGGIENHVHMLVELHSTVALSKLVQTVKAHSSNWMHCDARFPLFSEWGEGYYASTLSPENVDSVKAYIMNQREHHRLVPFEEELEKIYKIIGKEVTKYDMT